MVHSKKGELEEVSSKYDICEYRDLKFFECGNTIAPELQKSLGKLRRFLVSVLEENERKVLMEKSAQDRCRWIVRENRCLMIWDKDWEKIFNDIEENEESFDRYYSIMRLRMGSDNLIDTCIGLLINDDLHAYSTVLFEQFG